MLEDLQTYIGDLYQGRTDTFNYKTAYFLKRNWKSLRHTVGHNAHHIWDELKKVGYGFKLLNQDAKFYVRRQLRRMDSKFDKESYAENIKMKQVKTDFIKFIPFSVFIIVPGAELLLPAWLVIFPNSIPSQFLSDDARKK
jgi:hypothetical protein